MPSTSTFDSASQLRQLQVIVVALALGVVTFTVIAAVVGPVSQPFPPVAFGLDPIEIAAIASTVALTLAAFLVPGRMIDAARQEEPEQRVNVFRTSRMIAAALHEGPALLWCVALLLSGTWWHLVPIATLTALLLMQVPTRDSFEDATGVRVGSS